MRPITCIIMFFVALAQATSRDSSSPILRQNSNFIINTSFSNESAFAGSEAKQMESALMAIKQVAGEIYYMTVGLKLDCRSIAAKEMAVISKNIKLIPLIVSVSMSDVELDDESLACILELPNLQSLRIGGKNVRSRISNRSIVKFTLAKKLKNLTWFESGLDDQGLIFISAATSLEGLVLWDTKSTDVGVKHLRKLGRLKELCLASNLTDKAMKSLGKMIALESLDLPGSRITINGLKELRCLPNLSRINLRWTKIGDDAMPILALFPCLHSIGLQRTSLTNEGLKVLANMQNVKHLDLSETKVSNEGIQKLSSMTSLIWLNVQGTSVRERGAATLMKARSGLQVSYR